MYLDTSREQECSGCTACSQCCPKQCIEMRADEKGFRYPVLISPNECIHCNLCKKVCPIENRKKESCFPKPRAYYGWHLNDETRRRSTSGAAFPAIAEVTASMGYHMWYGVALDKDLVARHVCVNDLEALQTLQSSKYVQSDLGDTFKQIREQLRAGKKVVFSGTPCQTEGLRLFLGAAAADHLLLISLVCHCTASPAVFQKYIREAGERRRSPVTDIRFREKRERNGQLSHKYTTITFEDGSQISSTENEYTLAFGLGLLNRSSCAECPFTTIMRGCDITIGDFWGIEDYVPNTRSQISRGISLLLSHTKRGQDICDQLHQRMELCEVPAEYALHSKQQQLKRPIADNPRRAKFLGRVLAPNGHFIRNAQYEIRRWRITNFGRRVIGKAIRIVRKRRTDES